jgi:hypothetical protein
METKLTTRVANVKAQMTACLNDELAGFNYRSSKTKKARQRGALPGQNEQDQNFARNVTL